MVVCPFFKRGDCKFGDRCKNEHPGAKPSQISVFGGGGAGGFGGSSGGGFSAGGFGASNQNICQYFLKGTCRFGNDCRFSHVRQGSGQGGFGGQTNFGQSRNITTVFGGGNKNISFNRNQNRFSALTNEVTMGGGGQQTVFGGGKQQLSSTVTILQNPTQMNQIQQIVKRDMETWETSKQWPLSCYTYLKDEPCIPGLLDFSPEEIRKEAYDAKVGNKVSAYEQGLKSLVARSKQRRMELKNITLHQLESEIRSSISKQSSGSSMSIQSAGQDTNVFGGSPMSQSQGLFGNSTIAGQSSTLFGAVPSTQQSMSSFGSMAVSSPIAPNPTNKGLFGSRSPSQSQSLFGSTSATQNTELFGATSTSNTGNTIFGSTDSTTSPFGKQPTRPGLFGATTTSQPGMNVFGNASSGQTSSTSGVAPSACQLTCSEQDIAAFKADKFVLGQIPECPPPPELCR